MRLRLVRRAQGAVAPDPPRCRLRRAPRRPCPTRTRQRPRLCHHPSAHYHPAGRAADGRNRIGGVMLKLWEIGAFFLVFLAMEIGRAHVLTPVTNAHLVCHLLLEKKKTN